MKRDRARTKILRTSPFGLVEMTRQRIKPGLKRSLYQECPCCSGRGNVKTEESMALDVIRLLLRAKQQTSCASVTVRVNEKVSSYLNNQKRRELAELEGGEQMDIRILGSENVFPEFLEVECRDANNAVVQLATR